MTVHVPAPASPAISSWCEGPDATTFLQSLVSQDLDAVAVGATAHSLLLQPQGKLLVDFYAAHVEPDVWWCVCEGGFGEALASGLKPVQDPGEGRDPRGAGRRARACAAQEPPADARRRPCVVAVDWAGVPAFDAVGSDAAVDRGPSSLRRSPVVDVPTHTSGRAIEAGVPRQGFDTDERTIPQEAGLERVAVSFTKGCFVGQELVCRIDTRGHVNRLLRRLRATEPLQRGAEVSYGDKVVGVVTSAVDELALAMLRREIEPGAEVRAGAVTAAVETGAIDAR